MYLTKLKKIFFCTAILCLSACGHLARDDWRGPDKMQHATASAAIALAACQSQPDYYGHKKRAGNSFAISLSFGVAKEIWDSRKSGSGWSWRDLAWDLGGAVAGYSLCRAVN